MAWKTWAAGETVTASDLNAFIVATSNTGSQRIIIQGQSYQFTLSGANTVTITYPSPFPTACDAIIACPGDNTAFGGLTVGGGSRGAATASVVVYSTSGGLLTTGTHRINYIAIGH